MEISDTGLRGYLKWLQEWQPAIYRDVAPHIVQRAPQAFSDHEQSRAMGALMGLSDDSGTTTTFDTVDTFGNPATVTSATDVADVANSGATDAGTIGLISNLVAAAGQAYLAKNQVDLLTKVNDMQLQRAQLGIQPLDTSKLGLAVPQVNVGLSKSTLTGGGIALGVVALIAAAAMMSRHGGRV